MLNKVILIGNLGGDPEVRYTQDGTPVCNLRVATNERFKNRQGEVQERTEWHNVVLWGKLAEIAQRYLRKGDRVYIEGKLQSREWTDREGNTRRTVEIRASEMKMLSSRGPSRGDWEEPSRAAPEAPAPPPAPEPPMPEQAPPASDPFDDPSSPGAEDDIPF